MQGPKGKLDTALPAGIKVEQKDGNIVAIRENDSQAAVHGLARALVNNAVEGVTKGWTRELEIVGIGYRAEMKGKRRSCSTWATRIRSSIRCRQAWTRQ